MGIAPLSEVSCDCRRAAGENPNRDKTWLKLVRKRAMEIEAKQFMEEKIREYVVILRELQRAIANSQANDRGPREYSIHSVLSERRCQADMGLSRTLLTSSCSRIADSIAHDNDCCRR